MMSDKPHIPLSELRDMWQRAEDDAAPRGEGRKGTSLYFRHAVEEEIKRINEAERIKELEAELAQLRDQLNDMTNAQHINEKSLDEYARTIARLRAQLTDIKCNGYIPARDTVGGVISSEWDTPEEDAAWAHLEEGGNDE